MTTSTPQPANHKSDHYLPQKERYKMFPMEENGLVVIERHYESRRNKYEFSVNITVVEHGKNGLSNSMIFWFDNQEQRDALFNRFDVLMAEQHYRDFLIPIYKRYKI